MDGKHLHNYSIFIIIADNDYFRESSAALMGFVPLNSGCFIMDFELTVSQNPVT